MASQLDFVTAVLEELGVRDPGQPVEAEDQNIVLRRLAPKIAELNARNVCFVPDTDDISDEYFLPLVKIMAYDCASAFGVTGQKLAELRSQGGKDGEAEWTLKDVVRLRTTDQTLRVDRFWRTTWGRAR